MAIALKLTHSTVSVGLAPIVEIRIYFLEFNYFNTID